jgi:ATP-dependent exoDNAse (exonuclease V) beta subunit
MYVALTRAREKLVLSPACVEAISASALQKQGVPIRRTQGVLRTRCNCAEHDSIEGRLSVRIDRLPFLSRRR